MNEKKKTVDTPDQSKDDFKEWIEKARTDLEFGIDLQVDNGSENKDTPVDFSVSKELTLIPDSVTRADSTMSWHLAKMSDIEFFDSVKLQAKRIIHPQMSDQTVMNSFRKIRTRLLQKSGNKNFILLVCAIGNNMGATFTTVNLGAAFSYEGEKTSLLVDCHPQKDNLSSLLALENKTGLSDYIVDPAIELNRIIYPSGINRMRLIPFGCSRASRLEFLGSERMKEFLNVVKKRYRDRYIILDAPPLGVSADAAILAEIADYVLVVLDYGGVSNDKVNKTIKSLPRDKIAGVVMNKCKRYV